MLTADLHLSLCSSKVNPLVSSPALPKDTCCGFYPPRFPLHTFPIDHTNLPLQNSFLPHTHCFVLSTNFKRHSLGSHRSLCPGMHISKLQIFIAPLTSLDPIPHSNPQLYRRLTAVASFSVPIPRELTKQIWMVHPVFLTL